MVAGSILPIAIHNNEIFFLFGKENDMEDSAKGWSDFGGRCDNGETPYEAALREGGEELTGFLGNETTIQHMIEGNNKREPYKIIHNDYHVHMFCMDYDKHLPKYYNQNHKFLWERMDNKILNESKLFEKIEIKWYSLREMKQKKNEFRVFYQDIVELFVKDISNITKFIKSNKTKSNKTKSNKTKKK
jgi:8-oxo-dGTP pyrophosphatase MutT (NUDIX family)